MIKRIIVSIGSAALAFLAATQAQAITYSNAVQSLNPVAYWPLTETTAPAAGGLYIATNSGTAGAGGNGYYETWWQTNGSPGQLTNGNSIVHIAGAIVGDTDTAMQQCTIGQYVVVPRTTNGVINSAVTLTPPFTIEAWIFPTNGTANQLKPFLSEGFNNVINTNQYFGVTTEGTGLGMFSGFVYFNTFNGNTVGAPKTEIDTGTLVLNQWYHIVATFDGTNQKLYTNGVLVRSTSPALNPFGQRYVPDMVSPLIIGGGNDIGLSGGANVLFGGGIDEVAIYNTALSQAQVTTHYQNGTNSSRATLYSQVITGDSPSIYLRLDEPAFTGPSITSLPVANNYGSLGGSANGFYLPGSAPGAAGPAFSGFGSPSAAVALNGFNSGVDVGNGALPSQLNPTNGQAMTVTAWFKGNPADCVGRFQELVGHSDLGWRLSLDNNGGNHFNPGNGPELQFASIRDELLNATYVNDGNWHFIAGVSDGTNDSMYIDGVLAKSGTNEGIVTNGTSQDVILGGDPQYLAPQPTPVSGGGRWFDGSLAQVAFFTNALSSAQIATIYSAAGVPPSVSVQPPAAQAVFKGINATITAAAVGSAPLSYQWYTGSTPVGGQTTSSLKFTPASAGSAGSYYLVVTNNFGAATSSIVQVTVSASQATPYDAALEQLNPVAYWPLNETNLPPAGQYIATNLGTLGSVANGYYQTWYQPITIGITNTSFATNNIQHGAGTTGDSDTALLCGNATGAGQYVVLPRNTNGVANPSATLTDPFSVELWVRATNFASGVLKPIVTQGRNQVMGDASHNFTNDEYGFSFGQFSSIFYFQCYNGTTLGNSGAEIDTGTLVSNQWYYVVITFASGTESMYMNGVLVASKATTFVPDPVSPLIIGSGTDLSAQTGGQEFGGAVDDVAIYNTALTPAQIQAHFAATNGSTYATTVLADQPIIYYRLDEAPFNSYPSPSTYPVAFNYGSLGAAANGAYQPGTAPGAAGPAFAGLGTNTAVAINGFSGGVDIGGGVTPIQLNPLGTQPQTVVAWFQANPVDARFQEIVSRGDNSWRLAFNGNNGNPSTAPYDNHYNPGANPVDLGFSNIVDEVTNQFRFNDGNWHMVAGVSDGSTASMYLDGQLAKSTNAVSSLLGTNWDVLIGGSPAHVTPSFNSANIRYFNGQIARVAYFTNALTGTQVQSIFNTAGVPLTIISEPPVSVTNNVGSAATISVGVRGSLPVYQWYSTNVNTSVVTPVSGQTNASLVFNPANLTQSGFYFVVITNAENAVTSTVSQLTIVGPPVLQSQSATDLRVFVGTTPTIHLQAIGPSLTYQWLSNNVVIPNATNTAYTLTTGDTSSARSNFYSCQITNSFGPITVTVPVVVLSDPTAPYPAQVLADKPLYYFRLDEADAGYPNNGVTGYDYAGGQNGSYSNANLGEPGYSSLTEPTETSAGFGLNAGKNSYMGNVSPYVDFVTPNGSNAEFSVEVWVNEAFGQTFDAGIVTIGYGFGGEQFDIDCGASDPAHDLRFYVNSASNVTFHANSTFSLDNNPGWHHIVAVCDEAGGHLNFYIDGVLAGSGTITPGVGLRSETVPMSIGARLSTQSATDFDNQFFGMIDDVAIYNYPLTAAQVQAHYLLAGIAPVITQLSPIGSTNNPGTSASFTVTATGTQPLSYQWYDNNSNPINNATNTTLTLSNLLPSQSGNYSVIVSNIYGTATTNATLQVNQGPPVITTDLTPTNLTVFAGSSVTYSLVVAGDAPISYQWFQDGVKVTGATNSSFTFNALLGTNTYFCSVTNDQSAGTPTLSSTGTVVGMPSTQLNPANYTDKVKITLSGYNRNETLHDFPILVQLSTNIPGFSYAHFASGAGGDLRFTDAGGTRVIPHEIDEWNPPGTSIVWVQMPTLTGSNDFIWAYWGNPGNTTPLPGTNVWVPQSWEGLPSYDVVYHLKEVGFPYADSTGVNPSTNGNAPTLATGLIGLGQSFVSPSFLDVGSNNLSSQFTVSAWVNLLSSDTAIQTVWANKNGGFANAGFGLYVNDFSHPGNGEVEMENGDGVTTSFNMQSAAGAFPLGSWHLLTAVLDTSNNLGRIYVDTNLVASGALHAGMPTTNDLNLGDFVGGGFPLNGLMDEARIQFGTNSPNWVAATYQTVAQNSTFETYSAVTSTVANPVTVLFQRSGGNLILDGSGGPANQPYRVLSSTNLLVPMSQWTPVSTNNFDGSGNFSNGVPLNSTNKALFFRIAIP